MGGSHLTPGAHYDCGVACETAWGFVRALDICEAPSRAGTQHALDTRTGTAAGPRHAMDTHARERGARAGPRHALDTHARERGARAGPRHALDTHARERGARDGGPPRAAAQRERDALLAGEPPLRAEVVRRRRAARALARRVVLGEKGRGNTLSFKGKHAASFKLRTS